ncbi:MAG: hypothetical protein AVDCRST_MAG77-4698 [uncultured Chloroflexi bacterium]|uniref:DUF1538 domain-containing protein n=1 Tax=uncultured Chloroflexota bacterium TaxID=166587 RepID=A0A6J4JY81_9CHLR|nr:MAG: hypothetical protein AVDCRST_MAG77-4698 [uncultured Chloroflexota bacterium]
MEGLRLGLMPLNALGQTVEEVTAGAFKKSLLIHAVAAGVGLVLATGIAKVMFSLPITYLVIPPYLLFLVLTWFSDEKYTNIGWDSAGVTTGPITVPLVLAMVRAGNLDQPGVGFLFVMTVESVVGI